MAIRPHVQLTPEEEEAFRFLEDVANTAPAQAGETNDLVDRTRGPVEDAYQPMPDRSFEGDGLEDIGKGPADPRMYQPLGEVRDPLGLTPEHRMAGLEAFIARGGDEPEPAFEPLTGRDHPTATPEPWMSGPRAAMPEDAQDPGPSPMWEKFSNQQAHMGSGRDSLASLASMQPSAQSDSGGFGTGSYALAALADFALNKGRNVGSLLGAMAHENDPYTQQRRQMELAESQAKIDALNRRGTQRGTTDPASLDLRRRNTELAESKYRDQVAKDEAARQERDPNSEVSKAARAKAEALHPELKGKIDGLSHYDLEKDPSLKAELAEIRDANRYRIWQKQEGKRQENAFERMDYAEGKTIAKEGREEGTQIAKEEREQGRKEDMRQISGYVRDPNAPSINEQEAKDLRDMSANMTKLEVALDRLMEIDRSLSASERAAGMVGKDSPLAAEGSQLQQEVAGLLRQIANFGTPQAGELAITYARVPELTSRDGWINASTKYAALRKVMRSMVDTDLKAYGYTPGAAEAAAEPMPELRRPDQKPRPGRKSTVVPAADDGGWRDVGPARASADDGWKDVSP